VGVGVGVGVGGDPQERTPHTPSTQMYTNHSGQQWAGWSAVGGSDHTYQSDPRLTSPIKTECSGESQLSTHHNGVLQCPLVVTTYSAPLAAVEDLYTTCCVIVSTYQTNCTLCGDGV